MRTDEDHPILVFDGVCLLCSRWVRFILRHDRTGRYRFAAMQSEAGRALLDAHGLDPEDPNSLLLCEGGRHWTDSDAILRVLTGFGGSWRAFASLRLCAIGSIDSWRATAIAGSGAARPAGCRRRSTRRDSCPDRVATRRPDMKKPALGGLFRSRWLRETQPASPASR